MHETSPTTGVAAGEDGSGAAKGAEAMARLANVLEREARRLESGEVRHAAA